MNRRFTFAVSGPGAARSQAQGLAVMLAGLVATGVALEVLQRVDGSATVTTEVITLSFANLCVTGIRFHAMRRWMFPRRGSAPA